MKLSSCERGEFISMFACVSSWKLPVSLPLLHSYLSVTKIFFKCSRILFGPKTVLLYDYLTDNNNLCQFQTKRWQLKMNTKIELSVENLVFAILYRHIASVVLCLGFGHCFLR
ncbi:hypothetical protein Dimus_029507 [Dionaea muscipula]